MKNLTTKILAVVLAVLMLSSVFAVPSFAAALAQVKTVTITDTDDDEIELKWSKVSGATGYQVYLKKGNGSWKKAVTTKKTSADIEHLASAQGYSVKVRAYKKAGSAVTYGSFSNTVITSTEPLEVKNLTIKSVSSTKAKLSWSEVTGAEGYCVYKYDTASKKWTKIKSLTAASYTVTVSKNGGEKFKVRAYQKYNSKYYYGDFSSVAVNVPNTIGYYEAKSIALKNAGVNADNIRDYSIKLEKEKGIYVYEIEFESGLYEYEYEINAQTGKIIFKEKERR